jgi:hypothetical protein
MKIILGLFLIFIMFSFAYGNDFMDRRDETQYAFMVLGDNPLTVYAMVPQEYDAVRWYKHNPPEWRILGMTEDKVRKQIKDNLAPPKDGDIFEGKKGEYYTWDKGYFLGPFFYLPPELKNQLKGKIKD